jgi:hypothetical protein
MKKGKTCKINGFRNSKVIYGTVDSKDFKSLYVNLQTWVEPKKDSLNWERVVLNMSKKIKHSVYQNINKEFFEDNFIVDLDLRSSGLKLNKKSFLNLEINLYLVDSTVDFKSIKLKRVIKKLVTDLYSDVLIRNEYFNFYLTKNGNYKPNKIKMEKV